MAERTNAERNWETARQEEQHGRREPGEAFRTEGQRGREGYREGGFGGYQPSGYYEQPRGRGYGGGWQAAGSSDYTESGYYGQGERGGYGRPPGFRYQGTGYGASGYNAESEAAEWSGRPRGEFRPGSLGARGREGWRGQWGTDWRGSETGGWGGERGAYGGGWRGGEGQWEQERDFGDEGGWGGGAGFRGGYGGYTGQRAGGAYGRWQGGEAGWRGSAAPGYPGAGSWRGAGPGEGRGAEWGWQGGPPGPGGYAPESGWGGYGRGMRPGWSGGQGEFEGGHRFGYGEHEWGEPGRGMTGGGIGYGEPWTVPGPFAGRGPEGYQRAGDSIRDDVCERLTRHGLVDASAIRVRVEAGNEVVLEGAVPDRRMKRLAEDIAESVSGVRDVQNRLRVSERVEYRGTGTGVRGDERETGERHETIQQAQGVGGKETAESGRTDLRTGRPERDAERQKAPGRSRS